MAYSTPELKVLSLQVDYSKVDSGKDTASCCSGSCCYGAGDSSCEMFFA